MSLKPNIKKVYVASDESTCDTLDAWKNKEVAIRLKNVLLPSNGSPLLDDVCRPLVAEFIVKESDAFIAVLKVRERKARSTKSSSNGSGKRSTKPRTVKPTTPKPEAQTTTA